MSPTSITGTEAPDADAATAQVNCGSHVAGTSKRRFNMSAKTFLTGMTLWLIVPLSAAAQALSGAPASVDCWICVSNPAMPHGVECVRSGSDQWGYHTCIEATGGCYLSGPCGPQAVGPVAFWESHRATDRPGVWFSLMHVSTPMAIGTPASGGTTCSLAASPRATSATRWSPFDLVSPFAFTPLRRDST